MLASHFVVRHAGMAESHFRPVLAWLERNCYDRLDAIGCFGYPRVLHVSGAINAEEASVMWPTPPFVRNREIEQAVDCGVENDTLGAKPWASAALRI